MVVNCAGEGRRLQMGQTKALVSVLGEPLVAWHLRLLRDVRDVVVVVGHQAASVIAAVSAIRRDVVFALNHEYATTGTAASLALGCRGAGGDVLSLDGDLLVHPDDLAALLSAPGRRIGVGAPTSDDAVYAEVSDGVATGFNRSGSPHEWTGLVRAPAAELSGGRGHVYEALGERLPIAAQEVRTREIDTPEDYERALQWLAPIAHLWR